MKLWYYELMVTLDIHEGECWLEVCQHYLQVYDTACVKEEESRWKEILGNAVLFLMLAPFDNERSD